MLAARRRILANRPRSAPRTALFGAALVALVGCGPSPPPARPADNSLTVALESAPIHLDPRIAADQASSRVFELAMNGLVTKDENGNFVPDLAESWEFLDGGKRWRFHQRRDVRFHDGSAFDAADVVFTYGGFLDGSIVSPKKGAFAALERVVAVDPWTVDFVMKEPNGTMLGNLTSYVAVLPEGRTPDEQNRQPIGTGPFRVVGHTADTVVFAAFDGFFRGRPKLDRVVLREIPDATVRVLELRKGTVQLVLNALAPDVVHLFESDPRFRVVTKVGSNYVYLGVNFDDPVLADPRVRRALLLSLDRERLVRTLWRGLGLVTETLLPPGHWARNDDLPAVGRDLAEAERLLDAAGYPRRGDAPRLSLTYKTSTDETAVLQAQVLQAMAAEAGIRLEIRSYEFATFFADIQRGIFQLFSLTRTGIDDPDIYALVLHSRNIPPKGANRGRYRNPELDRLVDEGARRVDPAERRPFYLQVQELVARDLPYISLLTRTNVAVMPVGLEGFRHSPSGELLGLREVEWRSAAAPRPDPTGAP
jgi:peptide/nickel transport system substrate-binding protein